MRELLGILSVGVVIKIYTCVKIHGMGYQKKKKIEDQGGERAHTLSEAVLELNLSWCDWDSSLSGAQPLNRVCILKDSVSGAWQCQGQMTRFKVLYPQN